MHGGDGQFVYNFSKWISGVIDASTVAIARRSR